MDLEALEARMTALEQRFREFAEASLMTSRRVDELDAGVHNIAEAQGIMSSALDELRSAAGRLTSSATKTQLQVDKANFKLDRLLAILDARENGAP